MVLQLNWTIIFRLNWIIIFRLNRASTCYKSSLNASPKRVGHHVRSYHLSLVGNLRAIKHIQNNDLTCSSVAKVCTISLTQIHFVFILDPKAQLHKKPTHVTVDSGSVGVSISWNWTRLRAQPIGSGTIVYLQTHTSHKFPIEFVMFRFLIGNSLL